MIADHGRGSVLAIGIDYRDTEHSDLPTPEGAGAIAELFSEYGGLKRHTPGADLSRADATGVITAIADWVRTSRGGGSLAVLVLYIGGHGRIQRSEHFTLTSKSALEGPYTGLTAVKAGDVFDEILVSTANQVLLIFDSCYSGAAAADMLETLRKVMLTEAGPARDIMVLSGCLPYEQSYSGLFVSTMLEALSDGFVPYDPPERYEYIDVFDLRDELRRRLHDTQNVMVVGTGGRRVVPNPKYRAGEADRRLHFSQLLASLPEDHREHFLKKASGTDIDDLWLFTGREAASKQVVEWLEEAKGGMLVVTGAPGTGKSAFLGRLAVLADPHSRAACRRLGMLDDDTSTIPPKGAFHATIHLRNRSLDQAAMDLARQLGIELDPGTTAHSRDLRLSLLQSGRRICVLADALDEAKSSDVSLIAIDLLRGIAAIPGCSVLVGTRRDINSGFTLHTSPPEFGPILMDLKTNAPFDVIDLSADTEVKKSLSAYVNRGLTTWKDAGRRRVASEAVASAADGVFLYGYFAQRLLNSQNESLVDSQDWAEQLPSKVGSSGLFEVIEADLGRFDDLQRIHEVLRPLAFARGKGLPRRLIWPDLASELSLSGRAYNDADVGRVIRDAGWYLIEATDGGEAVYRLFHQSIADYLMSDLRP